MTTSSDIAEIIRSIGSVSSTKQKEQMIAAHSTNALFKQVLAAALDPYVRYHIQSVPKHSPSGEHGTFTQNTWELLSSLSRRTITGNVARQEFINEYNRLDEPSAHLLKCIVTKDLRAGIQDSLVNKAIKGFIPVFPYMRCCLPKDTKLDRFDWVKGVYSQEKADGMFTNLDHVEHGVIEMSSRSGTPFPLEPFEQLVQEAIRVLKPATQTHGELLVVRHGVVLDREIGNGILNSVVNGGGTFGDGEVVVYKAWDQIPIDAVQPKGKHTVPYHERFNSLQEQLESSDSVIKLIDTRVCHSLADAYNHYADMLRQDKEGTVIKHPHAIWRDGTSKEQVKLKLAFEIDLEIVGFEEGNGKNAATFGSIICRTSDGRLEVNVSGFKDKPQPGVLTRSQIWDMRDDLIGTIMTVRANDLMMPTTSKSTHSLFSPRFVEFRADKSVADTLQRVIEQYEAAKDSGLSS